MEEVDENVGKRFKIVAAQLFNTTVAVERGICSGACKDLVILSKWYVNVGSSVSVPLGETEIDNIDLVAMLVGTN